MNQSLTPYVRALLRVLRSFIERPVASLLRLRWYVRTRQDFRERGGSAAIRDLYPQLFDHGASHPVDPHYFWQALWFGRELATASPDRHVDVGSHLEVMAGLSGVADMLYVDLREVPFESSRFRTERGDVLDLPFPDATLPSVSSLHVIEHIGLGRYGDRVDPDGMRKAGRELARVVAPGGCLYVSFPVGRPRVEFNAHRVTDPTTVPALFPGLDVDSVTIVDDDGRVHADVDPSEGRWQTLEYGCGLFRLRSPVASNT